MKVIISWVFIAVLGSFLSTTAGDIIMVDVGHEFMSCHTILSRRDILNDYMGIDFDCTIIENHIDHFNNNVTNSTCDTFTFSFAHGMTMEQKTFSDAYKMSFASCEFPQLPQKFFERLGKVREINLTGSGVEEIKTENFLKGCELLSLFMSYNDLERLPAMLFSNTPNIIQVDFSYNHISEIYPDTFHGSNGTLKAINLAYNNIEVIDELLFTELTNLEILDLSHNFLKAFQSNLNSFRKFRILRLDNNQISKINCSSIFNFQSNQTSIDISMNHLEEIDLNCDTVSNYITLAIEDNHLKRLDFVNSKLVNSLVAVSASRNKISTISFSRELKNLKLLKVANNSLTNISNIFENCYYLEVLDLSFNDYERMNITAIPKMPHLVYFFLNNIKATAVDLKTISHSTNLRELDISHNKLTKIDFDLVTPCFEHLTDLRINNNQLTDLNGWSKAIFPSLSGFSISNNHLNCSYLDQFMKKFPKTIKLIKNPVLSLHGNKRKNIHGISCVNSASDWDEDVDDLKKDEAISTAGVSNTLCGNQNKGLPLPYIIFMAFLSTLCLVLIAVKATEYAIKYRKGRPGFEVMYQQDNQE